MSYLRFKMDLAIKQPVPQALQDKIPEIKTAIAKLKLYAEKINAGKENEEMTVYAAYHICHHDEGGVCEPEVEIK